MTFKEFIAPEKKKVFLFFILILITFLSSLAPLFGSTCPVPAIYREDGISTYKCEQPFLFNLLEIIFLIFGFIINFKLAILGGYLGLLLNLIFLYLLSCLIVYLYNKLKYK